MKLLQPLSYAYHAGVTVRHWVYDHMLKAKKLDVPVISIGNIVAGGSGKTPIVHYLATQIGPEQVAILSRGYKRKGKGVVTVTPDTPVEECGDEPLFLAQKLPKTQVIVGKNRSQTGCLIDKSCVRCILLDDGMQHRKLHRDIEICVVNTEHIGQKYFLPYGLLREDPNRLKNVDLIIINGPEEAHERAIAYVQQFTKKPITTMDLKVLNADEVRGKKVAAFCAIASPERFYKTLQQLDCVIVKAVKKPDHSAFTEDELIALAKTEGIEALVCTEKDAVKLPQNLSLPIIPIRIQLAPLSGSSFIHNIIKRFQT